MLELTKKINLNLKEASVISKALPDLFVKDLRIELVEKYFVIHEVVEKINLVIELLRENYLIVPVIIEESIEFVHFIKEVIQSVLQTRKACEYIIDLVFGMQTYDEFYNFSRSTILQLFKPIE